MSASPQSPLLAAVRALLRLTLSPLRWVLLLCVPLLAGAAEPPAITSILEFWQLPRETKDKPVPYRFECDITYYDEEWHALWLQDATSAAYAEAGARPLPIRSGQRVIVTGINPPGENLDFTNASFEVVGPSRALPVPIAQRTDQINDFNNRLVILEAMACHSVPGVSGHQRYLLSVEGRPALAWLRLTPGETAPDLTNTHVRLTGVYNPDLDSSGGLASVKLMIASSAQIEPLARLDVDPRFTLPRTPIDQLPQRDSSALVRISGTAIAQEPGVSLELRDESGQIRLRNAQTIPCPLGSIVEAIGYPRIIGTDWQLYDPVYRPTTSPSAQPPALDPSKPLRLAAQIADLTSAEASAGRPVQVTGIVTWSHPTSPFFFIEDASGAVRVYRDHCNSQLRAPGRRVEVIGVTRMGPFAPAIEAHQFTKVGETIPPPAPLITLTEALTGSAEGRYVEMRGYVREIRPDGPWQQLVVATASGDFIARIAATEFLGPVVDSVVRLRGVCAATADDLHRLRSIELWLPEAAIQIAEPALADRFARPRHPVATLGRSGSIQSHEHRLMVHGVVVHQVPGVSLQIIEDGAPLLLLCRDSTLHLPGTQIEAVGFLGRHGQRLALHETIVRAIGRAALPAPSPIAAKDPLRTDRVGQIVSLEGRLIAIADAGEATRLTIQQGNTLAEAFLNAPAIPATWRLGSQLAITGVYELQFDAYDRPSLLRLQLRDTADVAVLHQPPWLNRDRILVVAALLALGILLVAAWGGTLRRRVRQQTDQIRRQLAREAHLEAELLRTSKLESLGLLAGGIAHDFNNLLTVVMGNLSLLRENPRLDADSLAYLEQAEQAVGRSRDLTIQLLTFAKGGNPVRAAVSLAEVVQEVAQFTLRGSTARPEFEIAPDLWPAEVDKGQISQVVQNIVINAAQAMPQGGRIAIALANETVPEHDRLLGPGRYVRLTIADNGPGIAPEALPKIFDPYFTTKKSGHGIGLATVHSIVKKHQGHITVASTLGQGATFRIWLPASSGTVAPASRPAAVIATAQSRGRALVLDDEESIRRLSAAMLKRLGFETVAVPDGADAIRAYREALGQDRRFALVILDLTIPGGVGGEETIRELLKLDPQVCAIVSSGYSNNPILSDHRAYGFKGMVSKPYELADLSVVVDELLGPAPSGNP